MLGVVPADELKHPVSGILDRFEAVNREPRPELQGFEQ